MVDENQTQVAVTQLPAEDHGSLHQAVPQPSETTRAGMHPLNLTSPTATAPSSSGLKPANNTPSASTTPSKKQMSSTSAKKNQPAKQAAKAGPATHPKSRKSKPKPPAPTPHAVQKPLIGKPNPRSGPHSQQKPAKPPKMKPMASTSSKTAAPKYRKPKAKQTLHDPAPSHQTGPTLSDGKVERLIWQLSDGNGDPTPEIVEKTRLKKTGHPTWKLFTGRNVTKVPTPTNPPRFVYLDDKAAWDISCSKNWNVHEKHRFWPFDFTPQGKISLTRPNRGRPAYEADGRTYASMKRRKGERYWLHGCHPPPKAGGPGASAVTSSTTADVAKSSKCAAPAEQPLPRVSSQPTTIIASTESSAAVQPTTNIEHGSLPESAQSYYGTLTSEPEASTAITPTAITPELPRLPTPNTPGSLLEEISTNLPESISPTPPPSAPTEIISATLSSHNERATALSELSQVLRPLPANEPRPEVTVFSTSHPEAASSLPPRRDGTNSPPATYLRVTNSPTVRPNSTISTSSTPSIAHTKRSNSPTELPLPVPKRQRKVLTPSNIPAAVHTQDNQFVQVRKMLQASLNRERKKDSEIASLRQQLAVEQATNVNSGRLLEASEKKGAAFRTLAQKLYARAVDQQSALVDRHKATLGLLSDVNALKAAAERAAITTRRELQPMEALAKDVDGVLDRVEESMKDQGLGREFDLFAEEAMLLPED